MAAVVVMVLFMVIGGIGSAGIRYVSPLEKTWAIAQNRGTDMDWVEFCDEALKDENVKKLTPSMKKMIPNCIDEENGLPFGTTKGEGRD